MVWVTLEQLKPYKNRNKSTVLRKILYRIDQITEHTRRKEKSRPISGNWIIRVKL